MTLLLGIFVFIRTTMFVGSQFEQGIKINVFDTPILNGSLEAKRMAANISEFPSPKNNILLSPASKGENAEKFSLTCGNIFEIFWKSGNIDENFLINGHTVWTAMHIFATKENQSVSKAIINVILVLESQPSDLLRWPT